MGDQQGDQPSRFRLVEEIKDLLIGPVTPDSQVSPTCAGPEAGDRRRVSEIDAPERLDGMLCHDARIQAPMKDDPRDQLLGRIGPLGPAMM